ncbi:BREX-1 system phosphatase PglZ type B, partial [Desulfoprunum benzoelyticum]|nr:BREX-1 system phosphatase PglZ type B [Desulfoprunum benzoelyticum]
MSKVINNIKKAIGDAAVFNPEIQVAPACILWPDRDRQWEAVIPILQTELPELMILGDYVPDERMGPAIWLRCVLSGRAEDVSLPLDQTPIFYLPGVSRQDLRAVESCPEHLKPLAELQYRGTIWNQSNAKDWTILAFLRSAQGGLGLDVAQDNDTKQSMLLALSRLLDEDVEQLKGKRLDAEFFKKLLIGDPRRQILEWIDHPEKYRTSSSENE